MTKPVPKAQQTNPRDFQLGQLRRRFSPKEEDVDNGVMLSFEMAPSDPDFPFEMEKLKCKLHVPSDFPRATPSLTVSNAEMGKGYQINVEKGFDQIVASNKTGTLLVWMNSLDRQLEAILMGQKAETIKFIANTGLKEVELPQAPIPQPNPTPNITKPTSKPQPPRPNFTQSQILSASQLRASETRQLEARLSRLPGFFKSADDVTYTLPIAPSKPAQIPPSLRPLKLVRLIVPALYNLEPCRIELVGVSGAEKVNVERVFAERAKTEKGSTLMAQVNYLTQFMHVMAKEEEKKEETEEIAVGVESMVIGKEETDVIAEPASSKLATTDAEKPHIQHIPRPPEWSQPNEDSDSGTETSLSDYTTSDDSDSADGGIEVPPSTSPNTTITTQNKGIALDLPNLSLHGIELLELTTLNISVRCSRCKESTEVRGMRSAGDSQSEGMKKSVVCGKCTSDIEVGFRASLMHEGSRRAGWIEVEGGSVGDMLTR